MENTKPATSVTLIYTTWFSKYLKCFSRMRGISENVIKILFFSVFQYYYPRMTEINRLMPTIT